MTILADLDPLRQFRLRISTPSRRKREDHFLKRLGFLNRIELLPFQVFHELNFDHIRVRDIPDQTGNPLQACQFRRAKPPRTANDFMRSIGQGTHNQRFDNAMSRDRVGELLQAVERQPLPRIREGEHEHRQGNLMQHRHPLNRRNCFT